MRAQVLEVVPTVMRFIRTQMRSHRSLDLSVPQFRALVFIERTDGASLGVSPRISADPSVGLCPHRRSARQGYGYPQ